MDPSQIFLFAGIAAGAGIVGGTLAGLLGVGGGIVIVPALYFALSMTDMSPGFVMQVAVGTSLASIIFTSASSSWGHWKKGAIDTDLLKLWAPFILLGTILGGIIGGLVSGQVLIAVFALVAFVVALDMILRKPASGGTGETRSFSRPVWAASGIFAGGISAMMGIGGGSVCVPVMSFLGYDIRRAVGTSAAIGFVIGLPGAITYAITGLGQENLPPFSVGYVNLLSLACLVPLTMTFARVGVRLAHSIPQSRLRLIFGLFLIATAANMVRDLVSHAG
ncbi:membrane protein [Roseivivax halodurans JCM 10272]|uniref:Probable membrane transporter protein n=1 Tax=Roseivivax halodurans JCM 10272 TaxID=1449350 RepID=X7EAC8_9RHOB|nr:sulfite exporter TauE/SafE family protein [Roseivivax halodurans]ETX12815.1 membrane protein [Roseivivax halodurans JCM 10272]